MAPKKTMPTFVARTEEVVKPKAKPKAAKGKPKPKEAPASGSDTKNLRPAPKATPAKDSAAEESPTKRRRHKGVSVPATADTRASPEATGDNAARVIMMLQELNVASLEQSLGDAQTAVTRHPDEECRLTHPATCATTAVEIHPDDANTVIDQPGDAQTTVIDQPLGDPQTAAPVHPCEVETIRDPSLGCSFVCAAVSDPTTQATYGIRNQFSYTTP